MVYSKPVKRRRNPRPCVLGCGERTWDWDYVCQDCRGLIEAARAREDAEQHVPDGYVELTVGWHWDLHRHDGDASAITFDNPADKRIKAALFAVLYASERRQDFGHSYNAIGLPDKVHRGFSESVVSWVLLGDENTKAHLRDLLQAIRDIAAHEYREGRRDGECFIAKLASGEMSMDELQDKETKDGRK